MLQVYPDGDIKVDVRGNTWTYNSAAVSKVDSDGVPLTPGTSGGFTVYALYTHKCIHTILKWQMMFPAAFCLPSPPAFCLPSPSLCFLSPPTLRILIENVSLLLRHMFEMHQASNPVEELVKGAASGDVVKVEEVLKQGMCSVDVQFNRHTALQAASQNGHMDVVRCLIRYNANLEEEVRM